jgi:hypothetical protein
MLNAVASVNAYEVAQQVQFTQGDTVDIYFQLIDATLDPSPKFIPSGRRYMPVAGALLTVKLDNIDDDVAVTRSATQPFANDPSIWKVTVVSTDKIVGTCALVLTLMEAGRVTRGRTEAAVEISAQGTL